MDYEVIYSGTLERQAIEAQRRPAPPLEEVVIHLPGQANSRLVVMACLQKHPQSTLDELAGWTQIPRQVVNSALYRLRELGYVVRSHKQNDNRMEPVRYRLVTQ